MKTQLVASDYIVLAGYFVLMLVIGLYYFRYMKRVEDYFTAANQVPWWLAGISHFMSSISAFVFVAYSEIAYNYGFVALTVWWMVVPGCLLSAFVFSSLWRRARLLSPVEFLEARFSNQVRQVFAWAGIPVKIILDGLRLYSIGLFVSVGFGMDLKVGVIVSGVVTLLYTFMGGVWAVTISDLLQFLVLTMAVLLIFPLAWSRVGGWNGFVKGSPQGFFSITSGPYDLVYLLSFALIAAMSYNGTWSIVQRFYCVKQEKEARKVALLAAALNFFGPLLFLVPPMIARQLLPNLATPPNSPQYAYAALGLQLLPAGMMGIMIAAMLAAAMGALSADYNALSSVMTNDIYRRMFKPDAAPRHLRTVGMLFTLLGGGLATVVSLIILASGRTGLFNKMIVLFGLALGPTVLPMLGGLFVRRLSARGAIAGFVAGFASGIFFYVYRTFFLAGRPGISSQWVTYTFTAYTTFINVTITIGAMVLITWLERRSKAEEEKIEVFFSRMAIPISSDVQPRGTVPSPFFIIGIIMSGLAAVLFLAGVFAPTAAARNIDWIVALLMVALGIGLYRNYRRSFEALDASAPEE